MKLWLMLIWAKRMVNDLGARTPNLCYYVSHDKVFSYMYEDILLIIQPCKYILVMYICTLPCPPLYSYTLTTHTAGHWL